MEIVAHGIDLVDCPRIEQMIQRHGERFVKRVFTAAEQAYAQKNKKGWRGKIAWTDIEIINNAAGQPEVTLSGEVRKIADKLGIKHISISITHTANFAIASAVALTQSNEDK